MTTYIRVRRHPRFPVDQPCRIRLGDDPEERSQLVDLSEGGISLFYSRPVTRGTRVELRFSLNIGHYVECTAFGEVRHYTARGESHVVGVEFTYLDPESREAIQEFVRQKSESSRRTPDEGEVWAGA